MNLFDYQPNPAMPPAPDIEAQVEAAARALYEFQQGCVNGTLSTLGVARKDCCPPWQNIHEQNKAWYRHSARAALSIVLPSIIPVAPYAYLESIREAASA